MTMAARKEKRGRGRPPVPDNRRADPVSIALPADLLKLIDDASEPDESRSAAIRRLLYQALGKEPSKSTTATKKRHS